MVCAKMSSSRHATLYATTMAAVEAVKLGSLPELPPALWLVISGWLKHDQEPTFRVVYIDDDDDDDGDGDENDDDTGA